MKIALAATAALFFSAGAAQAQVWQIVGTSEQELTAFESAAVRSDGAIRTLDLLSYFATPEYSADTAALEADPNAPIHWIQSTILTLQLNCDSRQGRAIAVSRFDFNRQRIDGLEQEAPWEAVQDGSIWAGLHSIVCQGVTPDGVQEVEGDLRIAVALYYDAVSGRSQNP